MKTQTKTYSDTFVHAFKGNLYHAVLADTAKILIQRALTNSHGNQILASQMRGVHRNTIRRKIKELNINIHEFKT